MSQSMEMVLHFGWFFFCIDITTIAFKSNNTFLVSTNKHFELKKMSHTHNQKKKKTILIIFE